MSESSEEVTITPRDNGPYFVLGPVKLVDPEGRANAYEGRLALCRCGLSVTKPICDGTHRTSGFESVIRSE
ncbi:MAG TPA: CDGSH iron-sulfur domain-containing protein [Dehalococcoidia bacterium]|nr:CDGSH iron-sulfur domain-containing protein [Dehalococcoidia bacterium]